MIAQELEVSLHMAFVEARQKRHEFITVEHLLLALLDNPSAAEVHPRTANQCNSENFPNSGIEHGDDDQVSSTHNSKSKRANPMDCAQMRMKKTN